MVRVLIMEISYLNCPQPILIGNSSHGVIYDFFLHESLTVLSSDHLYKTSFAI
jgi:hypothetical protein